MAALGDESKGRNFFSFSQSQGLSQRLYLARDRLYVSWQQSEASLAS